MKNQIKLSGLNLETGANWTLTFQAQPPIITMVGNPTDEEILEVLYGMHAPLYMVTIVKSAIGFARLVQQDRLTRLQQ